MSSIFTSLGEQEIYLLKQFTALPNQWLQYDFLTRLLQTEQLTGRKTLPPPWKPCMRKVLF
ncbi:MAG: hypothetical protein R3C26_01895 [Calditrichia bacterium]